MTLRVRKGETVAILGASGSGKSTLLHAVGGLDAADAGTIRVAGTDIAGLSSSALGEMRNRELGFVYQFHHLLPEFTAEENVAMPGIIAGQSRDDCLSRAREMLGMVGLADKHEARVNTLSGGESQRVAIARAISQHPKVLLADEPTGNLDEKNGAQVSALLRELNRELGMTMVVVTHNIDLAAGLDRSLELRSGQLYEKTFA